MSYISLSSNRHMYFLNFFGCMVRLGTEKNIFSSSTVRSSDAPIPYIALEIWEFPCFFWQLPSCQTGNHSAFSTSGSICSQFLCPLFCGASLPAQGCQDVPGGVRNAVACLISHVSLEESGGGEYWNVGTTPWKSLTLFWEINIHGVGEGCGRS